MGRLTGITKAIWSRDPALDRDHPTFEAELKKANDEGAVNGLPLKDGRRPMLWHLQSLTERAYAELTRSSLHDLQRAMGEKGLAGALLDRGTYQEDRDAARRGIVNVEGAVGEDGRPLSLTFEDTPGGKALTTKSLEELYRLYGPKLIGELGRRVIDMSELDPT